MWWTVAFGAEPESAQGPFPGVFDHAPALQYRVALPGGKLNAASHSEWSSPLLVGDRILVGSASGAALYALSRTDGTLERTFPADASVESPAAVHGSKVVFSDSGGNTWCYDLDGTLVWRHDGNAPVLVAPTIDPNGTVVIVGNVDDLAVALDLQTGALVWQYQAKHDATRQAELSLFAAPRPAIVDGMVYLGFSSGALVAVDLVTGEEQWKRSVGEGRYPDLVSDPLISGNDVFASGYFKPLVAVDLPTHNVRWRVDAGAARSPTLIDAADGTKVLVHPGSDGTLRAIATLTGAELWRWSSGTSGALTSPVVTPAGLLVGSSAGSIYLVDPASGEELWRWHEPYMLQGLSSEPAVEGRQLVFTSNAGYLYSMLAPLPSPTEPARRIRPPL